MRRSGTSIVTRAKSPSRSTRTSARGAGVATVGVAGLRVTVGIGQGYAAADSFGNVSPVIDLTFTLDTGLPAGSIASPAPGLVTNHNVTVSGIATDPLSGAALERNPATLDPRWREISDGIYRLEDQLLVILDADRLLDFAHTEAA